jgi:LGFP repeat
MHEGRDFRVKANHAQGVVVGDGSSQTNNFNIASQPVDVATFAGLSPGFVVTKLPDMDRLRVMSLFATDDADAVTAVLDALLKRDEVLGVGFLADLSDVRVRELVARLASRFPWLESLPRALAAIDEQAGEVKWTHQPDAGPARYAEANNAQRTGFYRSFLEGRVYWTGDPDAAVVVLRGAIADYYAQPGRTALLGEPMGPESPVGSPSDNCQPVMQLFRRGAVYSHPGGVHAVCGQPWYRYRALGGPASWLGFPAGEASSVVGGESQPFERGSIFTVNGNAFPVREAMLDDVEHGWLPHSDEVRGLAPAYGTEGTRQVYRNPAGELLVACSSPHGLHTIRAEILDYYQSADSEKSWLGFPVSGEAAYGNVAEALPAEEADQAALGIGQRFEGGVVYQAFGGKPVGVRWPTVELIAQDPELARRLGFPTREEYPVGPGGERIQFFMNGNVTLRDGTREVCLSARRSARPDDTAIVPVHQAWLEYQVTRAYVCQARYSLRGGLAHIGFYADGEIKPLIPRIRGHFEAVPFTLEEEAAREAAGELEVADVIKLSVLGNFRRPGKSYDIFLLSGPDDLETVRLAAPIAGDALSQAPGARIAWTQELHYTTLAKLTSRTTSLEGGPWPA